MKSAEEWASERWNQFEKGKSLIEYYKQIQLDAIKEGMTRAETVVQSVKNPYQFKGQVTENNAVSLMRNTCAQAILEARDNLKELV